MNHRLYRKKPTVDQLWQGCVLATIAKALYSARTGRGDDLRWWDGNHYRRNSGSGDIGTLTFANAKVVAMFFDHESERSPWNHDRPPQDLEWYLSGMPDELRLIAEEDAIPYMKRLGAPGNVPVTTCAFWGKGNEISSAEPWEQLFFHGLSIINVELMDRNDEFFDLVNAYHLDDRQEQLLRSLFGRRMSTQKKSVRLHSQEVSLIIELGELSERPQLMRELQDHKVALCRETLASIGIIMP